MPRTRIDRWTGEPKQPKAAPSSPQIDLSTDREYRTPVVGERFRTESLGDVRVVTRVHDGWVHHAPVVDDGTLGTMRVDTGMTVYWWISRSREQWPELSPEPRVRPEPVDAMVQGRLVVQDDQP